MNGRLDVLGLEASDRVSKREGDMLHSGQASDDPTSEKGKRERERITRRGDVEGLGRGFTVRGETNNIVSSEVMRSVRPFENVVFSLIRPAQDQGEA